MFPKMLILKTLGKQDFLPFLNAISSSFSYSLDPFSNCTDDQTWQALERTFMKDTVCILGFESVYFLIKVLK